MPRYSAMVVLAKRETTYGTDATPTASANAILFQNVTLAPYEHDTAERPMVLPWYGNDPVSLVATRAKLTGTVDLAPVSAAGSAPPISPLLRACGLAETITASVNVSYLPVSSVEESCTLYFYADGTQHILLGARGTFSLSVEAGKLPAITFELTGMFVTPTAVALPSPTLTGFNPPLPVSQGNTQVATLGSNAVVLSSFTYTHGNQVEVRDLPNSKSVRILGRQPRGNVTFEAPSGISPNFWAMAGTQQQMRVVQGPSGGRTIEMKCDYARVLNPRFANERNVLMLQADLRPEPSGGNDEIYFLWG